MPVRDTLARLLGLKTSIVPLGSDEQPGHPLERDFDDGTLLSTYRDDTWPYVFARILAENGSQPPLRVGRLDSDGQFEAATPDHPIQLLISRPNPTMTWRDFIYLLITYLELVGHAPIEIARPTRGPQQIVRANRSGFELWPVNPSRWRIVGNADGTIRGYLLVNQGTGGNDVAWTTQQMTYLRWMNPTSRWYGQGRIAAARQAVMAEEYAAIRDKQFERRMGVPPGILTSEMPLGEPTATELQKRWEQAVGGYRNAGRIAVLGSKTTYQPVALSARDAEWLNQRQWRVHELAAAFGVPTVLAFGMKDATFANASEAVDYLWQETLAPRLDTIADKFTWDVLPLLTNEPLVAQFDYSRVSALNANQLELVDRAVKMANTGAVMVDEVRKVIGLDSIGDLGTRVLVPSTIALSDQAKLLNPPPPPDQTPPPQPPKALLGPGRAKREEPQDREIVLAPLREGLTRDLGSFFRAQRQALTMSGKADKPLIGPGIEERAIETLTAPRWRYRLRRIMATPIGAALTLGAHDAALGLGITATFALPASEAALDLLGRHLDKLGVGIQNTTVEDVRRVIADSLRAGLDRDGLNAALSTLFDGYEEWRLERIARTETTAAYNLGAIGQYRDAGVVQVKVHDGDGDEPCALANDSIWTLDEAEGDPLAHPNCTRTWEPLTEELSG